ncbi:histidine phosphatase family protein [Ferrimonas lipolytica]|uniref:Histidine phosphatase family protein n=1 Tax=Ferrimonas lipolytica TaxID=2724191 RepID=A0A6H1UBQ2_9GAMM|nr:histidine phosphatase family protein [Ferrimonas lipolytica]QIZ76268.1 histidine phosphatase family protein [Ferrimonas lipolytica]
MSYTYFTLIRHGKPDDCDRLLGRSDPELTDAGWQMMAHASAGLEAEQIISSPRKRCSAFARHFASSQQLPLQIDDNWQELDFGDWDGELLQRLWQQPEFNQYWQQPFDNCPPNGESTQQLLQRVSAAITDLSNRYPGQRLLIFTHSGVIRLVLWWLLNGQHSGNAHLSQVHLSHAAKLDFTTFKDENQKLWPQLAGLQQSTFVDDGSPA